MQPCGTRSFGYEEDIAVVRTKLQWTLLIVFVLFLFSLPLFVTKSLLIFINITSITLIAVLGLNFLTGYCGQISLGQSAFMGVGAYTSAILTTKLGFSFWAALPCAALSAGLIGLLFGLPSLRVKGFYLALATIAAQFIIMYAILHLPKLTGGVWGLAAPAPELGGIIFNTETSKYYLIIAITLVMVFFAKNLVRTRVGRAFIAIRDNDIAAEVLGINLFYYKLLAFFICSVYAGVAGSLVAHYISVALPEQFTLLDSIWYLGMIIVGGMGSTMGAIFGTVFLKGLGELVAIFSPALSGIFPAVGARLLASGMQIVFGLVIVIFLIFEPRGINHRWEMFKSYYRIYPLPY